VPRKRAPSRRGDPTGYAAGGVAIAVLTFIGHELLGRAYPSDVLMLYVIGIVLVAMRWSLGPAVATAIASVLCFDWFFVPPYRTLAVADPRHLLTFVVVVLIAVIVNRLTERVRDQAAKTHEAQRRVEAEQLRSSLLSSVSHDLRTPLAVITGTATTLTDPRLEPVVRADLAQTIVQEAGRLERLVRNLLDVTRVEGGALRVEKEWQPVEEVVGAALANAEVVLDARPVSTNIPHELVAPFDAVLVHQVLVNLLENAAKYTGAESPIEISASRSEGAIEIGVADRGPGVTPGDETRIFDKFYRAEKGRGGGVGLGLSICKGIVTAHGGRIWAENRADGGAAFRFTLPLEGEPPPALPALRAVVEESR
jgi:two-component system, OmpR family, sensor histidine kinase KdpD